MESATTGLGGLKSRRNSQPKFKHIKLQCNQLQSKYDIYNNGSPNIYQQDLSALKAYHIKNDIKTLELPSIDYLLQEMKELPSNGGTNHRDYSIHPSMMQKYSSSFKTMMSDQQEIKDFMNWMTKKQKQINKMNCPLTQKFALGQSLIAAGFNQMLAQVACVSRGRADIIKMLWNKQSQDVELLINTLHKQNSTFQRKNLQTIKSLHMGYQEQIIQLKNDNYCAQKKLEQATLLNEGCLNTLRVTRKQMKKYQRMIKQLYDANCMLKEESLELLQENTLFQMKDKNITQEQARLLGYRTMQMAKLKKSQRMHRGVKPILKDTKQKAQAIVEEFDLPDFEERKQKLANFIKSRMRDNPQEKAYIMKGQFSDEDDEKVILDDKVEQILNTRELKPFVFSRSPRDFSMFQQIGINTAEQPTSSKQQKKTKTIFVQTNDSSMAYCTDNNKIIQPEISQQENEDLKKLKNKRVQQRHSLMMIEMSKMMEFKKIDTASKIRRLSRFHTKIPTSMPVQFIKSRAGSRKVTESSISQEDSMDGIEQQIMGKKSKQNIQAKSRQKDLIRLHRGSILAVKSPDFQKMLKKINRNSVCSSSFSQSQQADQQDEVIEQIKKQRLTKSSETEQELNQFKQVISHYLNNKTNNKIVYTNPQKHLKKLLTESYKNLFVFQKSNLLLQMIKTAKNIYGNLLYESKLLQLIAMILQNKQKSLLSAVSMLMGIEGCEPQYQKIINVDLRAFYFRIYFQLSMKNPSETQFNIWGNYTNISKLSSPSFLSIMSEYFNQSKCMYLQFKIKQFIGIGVNEPIDGNYYVQLNPLMMYLMEVYLLEKKNYYESYHSLIDFLAKDDMLSLDNFIFLMDLLCLKEAQQKNAIQALFTGDDGIGSSCWCHKDAFYRTCIKYQLPLLEFLKVLKLEQFKKLPEHVQNDLIDVDDIGKWNNIKDTFDRRLRSKNKMTSCLSSIINKLDDYIKENTRLHNQAFIFLYRVVVEIAFS